MERYKYTRDNLKFLKHRVEVYNKVEFPDIDSFCSRCEIKREANYYLKHETLFDNKVKATIVSVDALWSLWRDSQDPYRRPIVNFEDGTWEYKDCELSQRIYNGEKSITKNFCTIQIGEKIGIKNEDYK